MTNEVCRWFLALATAVALAGVAYAGTRGTMEFQPGDEVYACDCGEKCPCDSLSRNEGPCTCGKKMVKAAVGDVKGDEAMLKAAGWDKARGFQTVGKYTCACPPACTCDSISQNPGKCTCGKEMRKVN